MGRDTIGEWESARERERDNETFFAMEENKNSTDRTRVVSNSIYASDRAGLGLAGGERALPDPAEIELRGDEGERGDSFPATFSASSSVSTELRNRQSSATIEAVERRKTYPLTRRSCSWLP